MKDKKVLEHDINNLLAKIQGQLELALLDEDRLPKEIKSGLVSAKNAAEELSRLINDFTEKLKDNG